MKKKVSVIIPVYNASDSIEKCILSLENQTYKNIEIIAINDGSIDNSFDILKRLEKKYKNLKIIDKKNEGVSITRNKGIKMATGDYIMFVDNDDYIDIDYIETYIKEVLIFDYDIVIGGYRRENSKKRIIKKQILTDCEFSKYIVLAPWAKLYKKQFLLKNKIEFLSYGIGEDVYFNLLAYSKDPKIKIINSIKYVWYFNDESVSNTKQRGLKKEINIFYLLDKIISFVDLKDDNINYFLERYIVWYLLFSGRQATKYQFKMLYSESREWLSKNKIKQNVKVFNLKGELLKTKVLIMTFRIIEKLNLISLFASIYCKGGRNEK